MPAFHFDLLNMMIETDACTLGFECMYTPSDTLRTASNPGSSGTGPGIFWEHHGHRASADSSHQTV